MACDVLSDSSTATSVEASGVVSRTETSAPDSRSRSTMALVPLASVEVGSSDRPSAVGPPATSATTSRAMAMAAHNSRRCEPVPRPGAARRRGHRGHDRPSSAAADTDTDDR